MLTPEFTRQFIRDLKLMEKRHKDSDKIIEIMSLVIWGEPLPEKYREHKLSGTYSGYTECHVEGNWLLIYRISEEKVLFLRTGSHSDLF
jgi:mRNA interferase YafQ